MAYFCGQLSSHNSSRQKTNQNRKPITVEIIGSLCRRLEAIFTDLACYAKLPGAKLHFQVQARDTVERINGNHVDIEEFRDRYERQEKPVVIQGTMKHWQANEKWSLGRVSSL